MGWDGSCKYGYICDTLNLVGISSQIDLSNERKRDFSNKIGFKSPLVYEKIQCFFNFCMGDVCVSHISYATWVFIRHTSVECGIG